MNTEKKLTAVEWLVEQIIKEKSLVDLDIEQAKEMFKQQIIDAYSDGRISVITKEIISYEQYYEETYKKD